jgi:hypothetical protein
MAYEKVKDCLSLKFRIDDTRYLMFRNNFISENLRQIVIIFLFNIIIFEFHLFPVDTIGKEIFKFL